MHLETPAVSPKSLRLSSSRHTFHASTVRLLHVLAGAMLLAGCPMPGQTGRITNRVGDVGKFVIDPEEVFVVDGGGMKAVTLNGGQRRVVFAELPKHARVRDVAPGGELFVLTDDETNLYLGNPNTGKLTRIRALDGRTGEVAVSPDGRTVAAVRHADYRTPQATWSDSEDDAVFLIDSKSFVVRQVPPRSRAWITRLAWERDGQKLLLGAWAGGEQILDLDTGARTAPGLAGFAAFPRGPLSPRECPETGEKVRVLPEGVVVDAANGDRKTVITREGYEEGHDSDGGAFHTLFFTRSCRAIVYDYQGALWVADIDSGVVGRLTGGWDAFPEPSIWPR